MNLAPCPNLAAIIGSAARRSLAPMLVSLSAVSAGPALAQSGSAATPRWQAEFGLGQDALSGGRDNWTQADLALRTRRAPVVNGEIRARRTERFGVSDTEIGAEALWAVSPGWSIGAEAAVSPTHRVLSRHQIAASVERNWGGGWLTNLRLGQQRYDTGDGTGVTLGVDRYFGSAELGEWRFALRLLHNRLEPSSGGASESGNGFRVSLDRYVGDGGRIGLIVADADELESTGAAISVNRVRSLVLVGRWPVSSGLALVGDVGRHRTGNLYRRTGARLGVQLDF